MAGCGHTSEAWCRRRMLSSPRRASARAASMAPCRSAASSAVSAPASGPGAAAAAAPASSLSCEASVINVGQGRRQSDCCSAVHYGMSRCSKGNSEKVVQPRHKESKDCFRLAACMAA